MNHEIRRIVVTGATGQIAYALLFRLAAGDLYGKDQKIALVLHDIPAAQDRLVGVAMELSDGAFPLLDAIITTSDTTSVFEDADVAFLIGAKPRGKGMERADLLKDNARIFEEQGKYLNEVAKPSIKVLVVGNPANTNALILAHHAPRLSRRNITAMMRLDHNRALSMLAKAADVSVTDVSQVAIWGNHSSTMFADVSQTLIAGKPATEVIDPIWLRDTFREAVANRGAAIINARGASSVASAANAALDHMRDWIHGSDGRWVSFGVFGEGAYGFDEDLVIGMPVLCRDGGYQILELPMNGHARDMIERSIAELSRERSEIKAMN